MRTAIVDTPTPNPTPTEVALRDLLTDAADIIGAFRSRLRTAGYPFPEPPCVARILAEIDQVIFPDPIRKRKSGSADEQRPQA